MAEIADEFFASGWQQALALARAYDKVSRDPTRENAVALEKLVSDAHELSDPWLLISAYCVMLSATAAELEETFDLFGWYQEAMNDDDE